MENILLFLIILSELSLVIILIRALVYQSKIFRSYYTDDEDSGFVWRCEDARKRYSEYLDHNVHK